MKSWIQHRLNAYHVYCRLHRIIGRRQAHIIATLWEQTRLYHLMYSKALDVA